MEHYNAKNSAPCLLAFVLTDLSNSKPPSRRKRIWKLNDLLHLSRSPKFNGSSPHIDPSLIQQSVHSRSRKVIGHTFGIHNFYSDSQGSFSSYGLLSQALPNLDFLLSKLYNAYRPGLLLFYNCFPQPFPTQTLTRCPQLWWTATVSYCQSPRIAQVQPAFSQDSTWSEYSRCGEHQNGFLPQ